MATISLTRIIKEQFVASAVVGPVTGLTYLMDQGGRVTVDTQDQVALLASGGFVLTIPGGAGAGTGSVTSVATGTGLTGGPIVSTGTIALLDTAVAPGTYGDSTHVAQITFDPQGRATGAANVAISGPVGGFTWPVHTSLHGIDPAASDNMAALQAFGAYLASISPESFSSRGSAGATAGSCTITIASPAVITFINPTPGPIAGNPTNISNGMYVSFDTTGALPTGITRNVRYPIKYGSIRVVGGNTTAQLGTSPLFGGDGQRPVYIGGRSAPAINTSGSQSGTHSFTVYGGDEVWTDVVWDPGTYFQSNSQFFCGYGIKKLRVSGYGVRLQTSTYIGAFLNDYNADTALSSQLYSAHFNSTNWTLGNVPNSIVITDSTVTPNYYIGSWALLMCGETQGLGAPPNQYTFEFLQIRNINYGTGEVDFYDSLRDNYSATLPLFQSAGSWAPGTVGPATIMQMSDLFDQEIELLGFTFYGALEEQWGGVKLIRAIDCTFLGSGFKTGPFPSGVKDYEFFGCFFRNIISEIDKLVDKALFRDCTFDWFAGLFFQSASPNYCELDNCSINIINGTPKNFVLRNVRMAGQLQIGPLYGATERIILENSNIPFITSARGQNELVPTSMSGLSFSNGTIKIANGSTSPFGVWNPDVPCANPLPWAFPGVKAVVFTDVSIAGHVVAIGASVNPKRFLGIMGSFTVLDTYVDGSKNYCVDTDLKVLPSMTITITSATISGSALVVTGANVSPADAVLMQYMTVTGGSLPARTVLAADIGVPNNAGSSSDATGNYPLIVLGGGSISDDPTPRTYTLTLHEVPIYFLSHPCPRVTVRGCTGGSFVADQVGSPADIPLHSYFRRVIKLGNISPASFPTGLVDLVGNLTSWTIDVRKAYTGATGTFQMVVYMFGWKISSGNYYPTYVKQVINLKLVGLRTILPSGTVAAPFASDALVDCPFWLVGGHLISMVSTIAGGDKLSDMPSIVMVGNADQNVDGSLVTSTATAGLNQLADTVLGTIL